ncbi:MAG: T9SS type A sorting domain-containing protein [Bacteroidales bacterium]|nr:T9SS type A sorting domain-containing protein [Bacteroidales bacterium]MDD3430796.1 T9SS type A sorting domain-containing protein [Bacteroidales bacterium]MDD4361384.1 T9SS type A sorting domain-containing protein [Bacteroidales bacterium]
MKHCNLFLAALFSLFSMFSMKAFSERIVRIEGQELEQAVSRISFRGDTAILHFGEGDSLATHCLLLAVEFTAQSGLSSLQNSRVLLARNPVKDYLPLENLEVGNSLLLYDNEGRLIKKQKVSSSSEQIDLSGLPAGVYLLRTGQDLIRFVKH